MKTLYAKDLKVGDKVGVTPSFSNANSNWKEATVTKINSKFVTTNVGKFTITTLLKWGNGDSFYSERLTHIDNVKEHNDSVVIHSKKLQVRGMVIKSLDAINNKLRHMELSQLAELELALDKFK